jgi:hypothetical protein
MREIRTSGSVGVPFCRPGPHDGDDDGPIFARKEDAPGGPVRLDFGAVDGEVRDHGRGDGFVRTPDDGGLLPELSYPACRSGSTAPSWSRQPC